ncbi:glycerate kinase [Enterococcus faecium]|nr:glycerate kinase [Enterococcus faecium]
MKIAIAGAGAMGSRIGLMLHQSGNEVLLIDRWPAHIEAIRTNGLIADFNGKEVVAKLPIYSPEEIIESNEHVDLIVALTKANQLDDIPGSGAAGGIGGALFLLGAKMVSGFDLVSQITGLEKKIEQADVIITGEGRIDQQTIPEKSHC